MENINEKNEMTPTQGQKERMIKYENKCSDTGFIPSHPNPYSQEDGITHFERLNERLNERLEEKK